MSDIRKSRLVAVVAVAVGALAFSTIPSAAVQGAAEPPDGPELARGLVKKVTGAGVNRHLIALQRIADQNGGHRGDTSPGFVKSAEYVERQARAAGFDVSRVAFSYRTLGIDVQKLSVDGKDVPVWAVLAGLSTPPGGVTADLVALPKGEDATPGCEASDYASGSYTGKIVLIPNGGCAVDDKQAAAAGAGAVAALHLNYDDIATYYGFKQTTVPKIPFATIGKTAGEALISSGGKATLELKLINETFTSFSVIAQTKTGRTDNVVMAGAHLDSVTPGPGVNDNGSGAAALLETALQLGGSPKVDNALRFAWWGAEELGLIGSRAYVRGLSFEQQLDVALYLNFDMIASPNAGYFVYDGDDSDKVGAGPGPYGSAQIEKTFVDFLGATGTPTEGTDFDGRSDYGEFIRQGIPAGGLFTGAEKRKTQSQVDKWGGSVGVPYDPCYHQKCDTLGNLDRIALDRNSDALAWTVAWYGVSTEAVNGVPPRATRAAVRAAGAEQAGARAADADARQTEREQRRGGPRSEPLDR